jgi:hypothetical protein
MYVNSLFKFVLMQNSLELCTNKSKYAMTNAATSNKKAKRPYIKKRLRTQDELWKSIITMLWSPFVRFCLEDWVDKIDFTRKPVFLDKELRRLMLRAKSKNRTVDVLMRVYLKNGTQKLFLLHIEVQGYFDGAFRQRIFQYYYRISDFFQEPIETLAILIDDNPSWRPNDYKQKLGETELYFKFRMFKLLDNPPPYIGKEDNPFSVVFEVAWYGLKNNMLKTDDDLMTLKFRLMRRLLENNIDTEIIYALLEFINIYLPFKKPQKTSTFERQIELIIDKNKNMGAIARTRTIREIHDEFLRENERKIARKAFNLEVKEERKAAKEKLEKLEAKQREAETLRIKAETLRLEAETLRLEAETLRLEAEAREHIEAQLRLEAETREIEIQIRQLETQMRLAILVRKLYNQGESAESIADSIGQTTAFVQDIIDKKE